MGLGVEDNELDQEIRDMLDTWLDFSEFGILPWERNAKSDDVFPYWKNGIRYIDQMQNQARENKNQRRVDSDIADDMRKQQQRRKSIGGR